MSAGGNKKPPVVLVIAGFDPTTGAGVGADLKVLAAHGCYGVAVVTTLTVQNTQKVHSVEPVAADVVQRQLDALLADVSVAAVKIGMLGTREHVRSVAAALKRFSLPNVVLDPVLRATSGSNLLDPEGVDALRSELLPLADVVTPNLWETRVLSGVDITDRKGIRAAAQRLHELGAKGVVITGGDLERPIDLFFNGQGFTEFAGEKVSSENTHGTGCAFSSAVAANLAQGKKLVDSLMLAKAYVTEAIKKGYSLGEGKGMLNHFYRNEANEVIHSHSRHTPEEGPADSTK